MGYCGVITLFKLLPAVPLGAFFPFVGIGLPLFFTAGLTSPIEIDLFALFVPAAFDITAVLAVAAP